MKKQLITSILMTIVTTVLLGLVYPLAVTAAAQLLFKEKANGQLMQKDGKLIGSRMIGQPFTTDAYFHSRPSAAGPAGYDAGASSGSNLAPTNSALIKRTAAAESGVPIDLVTTSGSGLDPHISPASAFAQVDRVAKARGLEESAVRSLVQKHIEERDLGFLGERRVNVLLLNMALDEAQKNSPGERGRTAQAASVR
jgi:K+-transporting ATPase ATPase C chain